MQGINSVKLFELVKNFHDLYGKANFCFRDRKIPQVVLSRASWIQSRYKRLFFI